MKPGVASALFCWQAALTEPMARHWERIARERGATDDDIERAWALWRAEQERSVQTIHSHGGTE